MPRNVMTSGLSSYIKEFTRPRLDESQIVKIIEQLNELKGDRNLNRRNHLLALKQRFESTTAGARGVGNFE